MKKIILIFILVIFNFSNCLAEKVELWREIFLWNREEKTLSKTYFAWKNFETIKTEVFSWVWWEKINIFPDILKWTDKQKVWNFIKNDKLQIYWQKWFCSVVSFEKEDELCIYDEENTFVADRLFSEIFKVVSEKDETINFEYYPISPDYFTYYRSYSKNPPLLTIFTNNLDIFEPKIYTYQKFLGFNIYQNNFEKKYKIVKMSFGNYIYIPYYSIKLSLKKWENFFKFEYKKL